jgi:hypothetical protein
MITGRLSEYFSGVASKRLRDVEVNPRTSNQHEFNGVNGLRQILGDDDRSFPATYMYVDDDSEETCIVESTATWYDARRQDESRSAEYRLYYPPSSVMEKARPGDFLVVARRRDKSLLVIIAPQASTIENQVRLLFGLHEAGERFEVLTEEHTDEILLGFVAKQILEAIGVEVDDSDNYFLEMLLNRFGTTFPSTKVFSEFARSTLAGAPAIDEPDEAIDKWMDREEILFRTLERHIVGERLRQGFGPTGDDVDDFIGFSLSVQNRRKARVGHALENHLEAVFKWAGVKYSRTAETEHKSKPDFLFPGISYYRDPVFPIANLTVLGVKSTCKDRWRQVLAEAQRINQKHLFTLEPGISCNQTNEMQAHSLQLVVPASLFSTYSSPQQSWLMTLKDFIGLVAHRQQAAAV